MIVPGLPFRQALHHGGITSKYGIAIHCTDNDASAAAEAIYAAVRTDSVSTHFTVDGHEMWQCLDTLAEAYHAGSSEGNHYGIAVEFVGRVGYSRAWWLANIAWGLVGRTLAAVITRHGIPPRRLSVSEMVMRPTTRGFYSHNDMRLAWGGTTHTDPGPGFPWDRLFESIATALDTPEVPAVTTPAEVTLYRGRPAPTWAQDPTHGPGVALDDLHAQEMRGASYYDHEPSYRTAQLNRIDAGVEAIHEGLLTIFQAGASTASAAIDALADKIAAKVMSRVLAVLTMADGTLTAAVPEPPDTTPLTAAVAEAPDTTPL